jgi:hypothetical protein
MKDTALVMKTGLADAESAIAGMAGSTASVTVAVAEM